MLNTKEIEAYAKGDHKSAFASDATALVFKSPLGKLAEEDPQRANDPSERHESDKALEVAAAKIEQTRQQREEGNKKQEAQRREQVVKAKEKHGMLNSKEIGAYAKGDHKSAFASDATALVFKSPLGKS